MLKRLATRWLQPALALAVLAGPAALPADAHGPTRQKVVETITIAAPASVVWTRIKNFDALKDWHPAVQASAADKGNTEGSERRLGLKGGGAEHCERDCGR